MQAHVTVTMSRFMKYFHREVNCQLHSVDRSQENINPNQTKFSLSSNLMVLLNAGGSTQVMLLLTLVSIELTKYVWFGLGQVHICKQKKDEIYNIADLEALSV